jgi:hypothetical protein
VWSGAKQHGVGVGTALQPETKEAAAEVRLHLRMPLARFACGRWRVAADRKKGMGESLVTANGI